MISSSYIYLIILLISLSYPALRYKNPVIPFYNWAIPQILSISITSIIFLLWDWCFTTLKIWEFNTDYILGIYLFSLPLEEILFFFIILYCCIFIYEVGKHFFKIRNPYPLQWLILILAVIMLVASFIFREKLYSFINFLFLSVVLFLIFFTKRIWEFIPYFFIGFGLSLLPFMIINGFLTSLPVVQYNDLENLGIRVITIPLDDLFYCMSLLFLSYYIYEIFKIKYAGKLNLKVKINASSGFCFGVVNAIKKAEDALNEDCNVYCIGQIVHNDEEINRLEKKGLKTIPHKELSKIHNKTILFRAHGEPPESYAIADQNKNKVIDASCSIILKIQKKIKEAYNKGENIYIYGKVNHPEIIALNAQTNNHAVIIENINAIDKMTFPSSLSLYSQTTKDLDDYKLIAEKIKMKGVKVTVYDTICRHMYNRKSEMIEFVKKYDKIIFIAGKNSSNGKVLFEICKNNNHATYFVSSQKEVKKKWFKKDEKVGVCGATSTPRWLMQEIEKMLKQW